jgi:DNA-binding transcriptional ArsR family regulator
MINWEEKKKEILSKLDIRSELESFGIEFHGRVSSSGWIAATNPFKEDKHPSCGVYLETGFMKIHNMPGGKTKWTFWDLAAEFLPLDAGGGDPFPEILKRYAKKVGVKLDSRGRKKKEDYDPPTDDQILGYRGNLTKKVLGHLHSKRGFTDDSIKKYEIGWSLDKGRAERNTFPVYDENGKLVNIRYHNSEKKPKTLNFTGYGEARLWGLDRLVKAEPGSTIICTEGELDSILVEQETGLTAVSPTNGCQAFHREWVPHFKGHHVVFAWDCDNEGRQAFSEKILPVFKKAVKSGEILSLKAVWLFEGKDKAQKDFTDFIVKAGGSGPKFSLMIEEAEPHEYITVSRELPEPVPIDSFAKIEDGSLNGVRVSVDLSIFGENEKAYLAPDKFKVSYCTELEKSRCFKRQDKSDEEWTITCEDDEIEIPLGAKVQLACVKQTERQMKAYIKDWLCHRGGKCCEIEILPGRSTLREVWAHEQIKSYNIEYSKVRELPIYVVNSPIIPIGPYRATGFVQADYRSEATLIVDNLEPQKEDWQSFVLEEEKPRLRELREYTPRQIYTDASRVTKIYGRDDLHLGVLLTILSVRWFRMPGEGLVKGWLDTVIIGDTGTGKTQVSETIFGYANVGRRVSGITASRTGIVYAIDQGQKGIGWKLKAGAVLVMSRQVLLVDEADKLPDKDLNTMSESMDRGIIRIDRVESRTFEAETRCIFSCNPITRSRNGESQQIPMDRFQYGCKALFGPFRDQMFIRRIDLFLFTSSSDIKDKEELFKSRAEKPEFLTPEKFKALVHYAWNLTEDQVKISPETNEIMNKEGYKLCEKFGQCDDLPMVYPQDFRKTFARLCAAFAILDLSSDDDFQTITVKEFHVISIAKFLNDIYSAENCRLDLYSKLYSEEYSLKDADDIYKKFCAVFNSNDLARPRILFIFEELKKLDPMLNQKLNVNSLADSLDVDRRTIGRDLKIFREAGLVTRSVSYTPSNKFHKFVRWLEKNRPDFLS